MFRNIDQFNVLFKKRSFCIKASTEKVKNSKTYQSTVFLPKTSFPTFLEPKEIIERDIRVQKEKKFLELYSWQRENLRGKEFVFHDGPPYANGKPHIGHAINKITKDIILRSQLIQGNRVHYVPGWDCHGLPIEMIALKEVKESLTKEEIRKKARNVATSMSALQKESFKDWGVLGDWENQCYYTFDNSYVINQIQVFWKLYERGLIYHDLKPVYWSPSSKTALAEAELVYKDHTSNAITVRCEVAQNNDSEPLYLLIWTTTPWTVPLNAAIYCSTTLEYSIVTISSLSGSYIVATDLIEDLEKQLKKNISVIKSISNDDIVKLKYKHPWKKEKIMSVFSSPTIKLAGTGLLHSVPAHGHEDFLLGLVNDLKPKCFVDENGCYTPEMGPDLSGLFVLNKGSKYVCQRLSSDILSSEKYIHSYPYDWRTDQPVIIRASQQWFIDSEQLKDRAVASLKNVDVSATYFTSKLKQRPYWCLSRQRTWGVPIPVFYHRLSGRPLLSKSLINHLCQVFDEHGPDVWWTGEMEDIFPERVCQELCVKLEDVVKGEDIMDIWFDSGTSWSYVLNGKKSEMYLEGVDQYGGWFQSSLFTSVGVTNEAPFKKIFTHGFAVDSKGRKMSKSLGNVVDPEKIIKGSNPFGIDTLRWWVGSHFDKNIIQISETLLKKDKDSVQKVRSILRYLLGALKDVKEEELNNCKKLGVLDQFILNSCYLFYNSVLDSYNSCDFLKVCTKILHFVTNDLSARYIAAIKDRLYCDSLDSDRRKACLYTINGILNTVCYAIAPILPHLAEEVYLHHPVYSNRELFRSKWSPPEFWNNSSQDEKMKLLEEIKKQIFKKEKSTQKITCLIEVEESDFNILKEIQDGQSESVDSELTEIFQVAEVILKIGTKNVTLTPSKYSCCLRCRRHTALENNDLCVRCESIVFTTPIV